jgi:hypothetical protein
VSKRKGRETPRQKITRTNTKPLNLKAIGVGTSDAESGRQVVEMMRVRTRHAQRIPTSVREEIHFVEPDVVGLLRIVAVQLKCDVDFFLIPIRLSRVVGIDGVGLIGDAHRDVMHLITDTFQIPCEVDPGVRGEMIAGH